MAKQYPKLIQLRSGKGEAFFPSVHAETIYDDKPTGKRVIAWIHDDEGQDKKFIEACEATWQKLLDDPEAYGVSGRVLKQLQKDPDAFDRPMMPFKEDEKTGRLLFKANANHYNKDGEVNKPTRVFDAAAKPTSEDVLHGATVKVAVSVQPYLISDRVYGVKLRMDGVQLLKQGAGLGGGSNPFDDESDEGFAQEMGHDASEDDCDY
ncbi:hypothetical protein BUE93_07790 [Chromobacterium amazonense]|uniref:Single-stranded DNA-binding protein n=1 Tax=Chromobacterium amazonense TaxID=1382803 RepID=A0A2S9X6A5_9NEIS|nr:hypothetical protein [Chromobacterium amazonense]PRP71261.1 hypothetical protein BUE93_07790 [Chromobacterium amazonense]